MTDASGNEVQPADIFKYNTRVNFLRYGAYIQVGKRWLEDRLSISAALRTDGNTFLNDGNKLLERTSPRIAASYILATNWTMNATAGRYTRLPPYTVVGFQQNGLFYIEPQFVFGFPGGSIDSKFTLITFVIFIVLDKIDIKNITA